MGDARALLPVELHDLVTDAVADVSSAAGGLDLPVSLQPELE
jgi:hypothetical protein